MSLTNNDADDVFAFTADDFYALLNDPVMFLYAIFGLELPPHQRLQLRSMWFTPLYVDTSGYRSGKSMVVTYCQLLQCLLISGWQEGILSHTMRGAQYLFRDHIDFQYNTNPLFRALVRKPPTHGAEWRIEFRNGSSITAYPSDLLNQSMRLESLSLHGCTIDEATAFPDPDVLWDVIFNRVTMPVPEVARKLGISNTVRVLGAAKYTFQSIYKPNNGRGGLIHMVIKRMKEWAQTDKSKRMDYVFLSFNLDEYLPQDTDCWACGGQTEKIGQRNGKDIVKCKNCGYERIAWRTFFASTLQRMRDAKQLMSPRLYKMRWLGKWADASDEVYDSAALQDMPSNNCLIETQRLDKDDIYTFGVDIGTGASEKHSSSAITVIKKRKDDPHFYHVFSARVSGTLTELSGIIHSLAARFSPSIIMLDAGGGGVWLVDRDHLGNREQVITYKGKTVKKEVTPLLMLDDFQNDGTRVLQLFTPKMPLLNAVGADFSQTDQLINWAHGVVNDLITGRLIFQPKIAHNDEEAFILNSITKVRSELREIGIVQNPDGTPALTKNGYFRYEPKPDLAYSFIYSCVAMFLVTHKRQAFLDDEYDTMTMPLFTQDLLTITPREDVIKRDISEDETTKMLIIV